MTEFWNSSMMRQSPVFETGLSDGGKECMSQLHIEEFTRPLTTPASVPVQGMQRSERLLNAREVAERLGVSERFIRDHTTRRLPRIAGVRLGKLIRYRIADVDLFITELHSQTSSHRSPYRV